jgi:tRNA threonylcarbamoyladenosine biosynthesis protein TsaB
MSASEPILFFDASRPELAAGVLAEGRWLSLERAEGDAIALVPALAGKALAAAGLAAPSKAAAYAFCEGPGSLLSLRLAAMCINSWLALPENAGKKVLGYRSVEVAAALLALEEPGAAFRMATAVRRGTYYFCDEKGEGGSLASAEELAASPVPVRILLQRRSGRDAEPGTPFAPDLARLPQIFASRPELFREKERAEVFAPLLSEYKLWEGARHRAPESRA